MGKSSAPKSGPSPSTAPAKQTPEVTTPRKKRALQSDSDVEPSPSGKSNSKSATPPTKRAKRDVYRDTPEDDSDSDSNEEVLRRGSNEIIANGLDLEIADMTNQDDGFEDWSELELALFNKLNKRGFEPLFQTSWQMDFDTLPDELFTPELDDAYFKALCGSEFRASKALLSLLTLGARVRETIYLKHRSIEKYVSNEIEKYIKWSLEDAKDLIQEGTIPILTVVHGTPKLSAVKLINKATKKMVEMFEAYEETSSTLDQTIGMPCIFCIVVSDAIIQLLALPSISTAEDEDFSPRTLAIFDFRDSEQDVWNSLAVAIIVTFCRNWIISEDGQTVAQARSAMKPNGRYSKLCIQQERAASSDPDL